jgi:hypothetical protein
MKNKIKGILNNYEEQIERYELQVEKLIAKMDFCSEHKFNEEFRIANVEYQALNMCVYRWREMHKEVTYILDETES